MSKKIKIIGGSLGGLVAAAELSQKGYKVSILERSTSIGGLYNNVDTPFGEQELGMHVVYVSEGQLGLLSEIFGESAFDIMRGIDVDVGGCANHESTHFNSHYPNLIHHKNRSDILNQIKKNSKKVKKSVSAFDELHHRFGEIAAVNTYIPIIEKLWRSKASNLTTYALNCFFDLRRIVICEQPEAILLKQDPILDSIIANPNQREPTGKIYDGRLGIIFKKGLGDLTTVVENWAHTRGIELVLNAKIELHDNALLLNGIDATLDCDACILGIPLYGFAKEYAERMDKLQLSIFYFELTEKLKSEFPSYYILAHGKNFNVSRIVNYDGYSNKNQDSSTSILSAECVHPINERPEAIEIADEIGAILPTIKIKSSYSLPNGISVFTPTINNGKYMDKITSKIIQIFNTIPVYFTGMRTDTGIFFSHHTIGAAHAAALEIDSKFS